MTTKREASAAAAEVKHTPFQAILDFVLRGNRFRQGGFREARDHFRMAFLIKSIYPTEQRIVRIKGVLYKIKGVLYNSRLRPHMPAVGTGASGGPFAKKGLRNHQ